MNLSVLRSTRALAAFALATTLALPTTASAAPSNDEPPENHYHNWRYPPLVDWSGWPTTSLRDILMNADFGSATIKVTDKDDRFRNLLNASKPSGIPFDPWA